MMKQMNGLLQAGGVSRELSFASSSFTPQVTKAKQENGGSQVQHVASLGSWLGQGQDYGDYATRRPSVKLSGQCNIACLLKMYILYLCSTLDTALFLFCILLSAPAALPTLHACVCMYGTVCTTLFLFCISCCKLDACAVLPTLHASVCMCGVLDTTLPVLHLAVSQMVVQQLACCRLTPTNWTKT